MTLNSRDFRDALGHFATGVTVISARDSAGEPIGVTVNSFASVSLDPPLVLWSLDTGSDRYEAMMCVTHFSVNILGEDARSVSQALSRKGKKIMAPELIYEGKNKITLLKNAIANFECEVERRIEAGDHVMFIGRVLAFSHASHEKPLVYYRGNYRTIAG